MARRKSIAARSQEIAREHPDWSATQIAEQIPGASRQAVESGLRPRSGRKGGRPGVESTHIRISRTLLDAVHALTEREGEDAREWIEEAITERLRRTRRA